MKKILSLLTIAFFASNALWADDIDIQQAMQIANEFTTTQTNSSKRNMPEIRSSSNLAHTVRSTTTGKANVYVINLGNDGGFVLVSGESSTDDEILGWCDHGSFDYESVPPQLKNIINTYSLQIDTLRATGVSNKSKIRKNVKSGANASVIVGPLLTTTWSQWWPYNMYCPEGCPTGCTITAIAQVMNYWKWPKTGFGSFTHDVLGVTIDYSQSTYDWDNMANDYSKGTSHTDAENAAVAKLMYEVGIAYGTQYKPIGSSASLGAYPLTQFFRYSPDIRWMSSISDIKKELDEGRPLLYSGDPDDGVGHVLVCDGYNADEYFHFNYGWGGQYDGYYKLGALHLYNNNYTFLGGIQPQGGALVTIGDMVYRILSNGEAELKECNVASGNDVSVPDFITYDGKNYPVTKIGGGAFKSYLISHGTLESISYNKVVIGNNVRTIAPKAGQVCRIKTLVVGDKVEEIGDDAFNTSNISDLTLGASVKRIGKRAFQLCNISKFICNSQELEIDDYAFYSTSTTIDNVEWLRNVTKIGTRALAGCRFGDNIIFDKLEEIGSEAFSTCSMGNVTFPASLRKLSPDTFQNSSLFRVDIDGANSWFKTVSNSGLPLYITNKSQTRLVCVLPVTWNDGNYGVPDRIIKIDEKAFPSNTRSVDIPASVMTMEGAFANCSRLTRVSCYSSNPPVITDKTFNDNIFKGNTTLNVPEGSGDIYRNTQTWSRFSYILDDLELTAQSRSTLNYNMVVHQADGQGLVKPVDRINDIYVNNDRLTVDSWSTELALVDSVTWQYDFAYDDAETFILNDSILTAKAIDCTVTIDPTVIDRNTILSVRSSLTCPVMINGATQGKVIDIKLGNIHELSGTAEIRIPIDIDENEVACAAWYNTETGEWEPVCGTYDAGKGEICILTSHLSTFGCFSVSNDFTSKAHINITNNINEFVMPEFNLTLSELVDNMKEILESPLPEETAFDLYANQLGDVLAIGNDMVLGFGNGVAESMGFNTTFSSKINESLGYLGATLTLYQIIKASYNRDEELVLANSLRLVVNCAQMAASKVIGGAALTVSMAAVAFIDYSIQKIGQEAQNIRKDQYQRGFDRYISTTAKRTAVDWYNVLYPIFSRTDLSESDLNVAIEKEVHDYCWRFWTLQPGDQEEYFNEVAKWGPILDEGLTDKTRNEISGTLRNDLYNGVLVSVFQAIKKHKETEAHQQAFEAFKKVCRQFNQWITLYIRDSKSQNGGEAFTSEFAGCKVNIAGTTGKGAVVADPQAWECTLDKEGNGKIQFTTYGYIQGNAKPMIQVYNKDDEIIYKFPFEIKEVNRYGELTKLEAWVDLQQNGIEVLPEDDWHFTIDPSYCYFDDNEEKEACLLDFDNVTGEDKIGFYQGIKDALSEERTITLDKDGNFNITTDGVTITGIIDQKTHSGNGTFSINTQTDGANELTEEQYFDWWWGMFTKTNDDIITTDLKQYTAKFKSQGNVIIGYSERANSYIFHLEGNGSYTFDGEVYTIGEDVDSRELGDGTIEWFYTSKKMKTKGVHVNNGQFAINADLLFK